MPTADAVYIALAELLDAPPLTRDGRIASAPGHDRLVNDCGHSRNAAFSVLP